MIVTAREAATGSRRAFRSASIPRPSYIRCAKKRSNGGEKKGNANTLHTDIKRREIYVYQAIKRISVTDFRSSLLGASYRAETRSFTNLFVYTLIAIRVDSTPSGTLLSPYETKNHFSFGEPRCNTFSAM